LSEHWEGGVTMGVARVFVYPVVASKRVRLTVYVLALAGAIILPAPSEAARIETRCSNQASDAAAINRAIAGSDVGDEIVFDGPCLINETIKLLGDRSYRGESRTGTVLKQADGANLDAILVSDSYLDNSPTTGKPVSVRSLTLDGNQEHNTAPTVGMILRSWQTVIEDVQISHMGGHGIRLTSVSADGTELENTQVNGQIVGNFIEHSGEHGIFVEDPVNAVTDWDLIGNWIGYSGADGIHMENAAGWVIERNRVYSVLENAIYADRMYGTSISNNYIDGFGETEASGTWYGINGTIQGETASTIANNRVFNSDSNGESTSGSTFLYIAISRVYDESGLCSVTGNVIRGAGTERGIGLSYDGGENPLTVVSTGNAVVDVHTPRFVGPTVTVDSGV
jgi:hypothetical protein